MFLIPLTLYLASRFELCGVYFNQIDEGENAKKEDVQKLIKTAIGLHAETIEYYFDIRFLIFFFLNKLFFRFYELCKEIMQPLVLIESSTIISILCLQMLLIFVNPWNMGYLILIGAISEVLLYCILGEWIAIKAFDVSIKLYCSKWYNIKDTRLKKYLIVALNRAQEPRYFAVGNMFPFNMDTFGRVMTSTFKVFNVFKESMKIRQF